MNAHSRARNVFCATCLSQGRQMFTMPLQDIKPVSMFYKELTLTNNDKICWECKHFVIKMVNFKFRALKAQSTLAVMINKQPISLPSLSKLRISKGTHLEITNPPQKMTTEQNPDPLMDILKSEPDLDYALNNGWNVELAPIESGEKDEVTFEVYQHKVKPSETLDTVLKLEPVAERETPGAREASVFQEPVPERPTSGVWGGVGFADATLMSLLNRRQMSYPPISAVLQRKLPMMEVPSLRILPKNPIPVINVQKRSLEKTSEKPVPDPSGPCFTEERLTEEERQRWWESKKENEFYTDRIEVFKCKKCVEPFSTRRTFLSHEKMHTELFGKHSCKICELRFHTEQALATHKDTHYRLLKCTRCAHTWDSHNSMRLHCEIEHRIPVTVWTCVICLKELTEYGRYLNHLRGHGRESCPQCGKGVFVARMKCHMLTHKVVDRPFNCSECHKSFKIKQHLTLHVTRVHSSKDEMMYCAQCDKQFKHSYSYNHHMKYASEHISKGNLMHNCTECSRVFPTRGFLRQHVARMHSNERKYECPVCHEMFKSSATRTRHRRQAHENFIAPKDKICDHCGKAFKDKKTLSDHINMHTGNRPFVCTLCGADFGYKSALYLHGRYKHKIPKKNNRLAIKEVKVNTEEAVDDKLDQVNSAAINKKSPIFKS
ncbi:zinc finger protein 595-like [Cydia pomonella]|uniref:zinc finger protein 595-like n=1 Tax=Cydia pomonella TaxID=82600 RepID=UPI002ADE037A|nr:zinc finger protein 595-like [Cydia pomonella]